MIERRITSKILRDLSWSPILGLIGSRQVGKTTLVKHVQSLISKPSIYLDLELPEDNYKLTNPQTYLTTHANKCVIIDEIQVKPELFPILRGLTDMQREPARFILLGSASPHIIKHNSETLAGRIAYHELSPFSWSEVKTIKTMPEHWRSGGFPLALLAVQPIAARKWMDDFVETYIYRDLARLGFKIAVDTVRNLLSMVAHLHGSLLNVNGLAGSLGVTQPTTSRYLEILEGSFLIRRLPPYFRNIGKRLSKSPKMFVRDSGLLHHLLRIFDTEQLMGHPSAGASWEGYVIEQIIAEAPEFTEFYHYRTQGGAEVDLLLKLPNDNLVCIEVKISNTPSISRGFYESIDDLQPVKSFVITPGSDAFTNQKGVKICSLTSFLAHELQTLEA